MGRPALRSQAQRQPRSGAAQAVVHPLIVVDEIGCIPFDPEAANLMFSLVSSRYERASMIVTSNKPFSAWGEIFGDDMAATAMIDRLIDHSEILSLKGDSYRLRGKDLDARMPAKSGESWPITLGTLDEGRTRALTRADVRAASARDPAIVVVLLYTGLRLAELVALDVED